jgi:hypothetical protein
MKPGGPRRRRPMADDQPHRRRGLEGSPSLAGVPEEEKEQWRARAKVGSPTGSKRLVATTYHNVRSATCPRAKRS